MNTMTCCPRPEEQAAVVAAGRDTDKLSRHKVESTERHLLELAGSMGQPPLDNRAPGWEGSPLSSVGRAGTSA